MDLLQDEKRHDGRAIVLGILCVTTVVVLLEDSSLHDLSIVDELLERSRAGGSRVLDVSSFLVVPLAGIQVEEFIDGVAHQGEGIAKRLQLLVEALAFNFIGVKSLGCTLQGLPLAGQGLDHAIRRVSQVDDWSAGDEDVDLVLEVAVPLS